MPLGGFVTVTFESCAAEPDAALAESRFLGNAAMNCRHESKVSHACETSSSDAFQGSQPTASRYVTLARNRSRVNSLLDNNPDLSIREAVKNLGSA